MQVGDAAHKHLFTPLLPPQDLLRTQIYPTSELVSLLGIETGRTARSPSFSTSQVRCGQEEREVSVPRAQRRRKGRQTQRQMQLHSVTADIERRRFVSGNWEMMGNTED